MTLSLSSITDLRPSPSNSYSNREDAAELGQLLFFDPNLSANGSVSCSNCHRPDLFFSDGLKKSKGMRQLDRNAPTLVGAAYSPWQLWDGGRDSLWAQALSPIEATAEMSLSRVELIRRLRGNSKYRESYNQIFGKLPSLEGISENSSPLGGLKERQAWDKIPEIRQNQINIAFANIGKSLEAYQRKLLPKAGRFDQAMKSLNEGNVSRGKQFLSDDEWKGAKLFVNTGKTLCLRCHNGPLLTNHSFHRIGINSKTPIADSGRFAGIDSVLRDPFNCLGEFSDAEPEQCKELRFLKRRQVETQYTAFKTPTLRGLEKTAPYMHDGSFSTLREVLEHYRDPPLASTVQHELTPLTLSNQELRELEAFLLSLGNGISTEQKWLRPPRSNAN
jgi:cytochrome c peroxidase